MASSWARGLLLVLAAGCVRDVDLTPPPTSTAFPSVPCEGCAPVCLPAKDACTRAEDCCSGLCEVKHDGTGTCKAPGCRVAHDACSTAKDCCSGVCLLAAAKGGSCQPASGCSPAGERCSSGLSCCSGFCRPGPEAVLRCAIAGCRRLGEGCEKSNECCDPDPQGCRTGLDSSLRCLGAPGTFDVCQPDGATCAVPEQCCSGACKPGEALAPVCRPITPTAG